MSRDRSLSGPSIIGMINDGTPLYYCDRNLKSINTARKAEFTLYVVSALTVVFIIAEFIGGFLANSLAVMSDAGHMTSDLLSFIVSIAAIKLAQKTPTKSFNFGFYRAEVLGALISVLMIWSLTAILVYAAVQRIKNQDFELNVDMMLYTALISVVFNLIMGAILYFGKTPHAHFGLSHDGHSHHDTGKAKTFPINVEDIGVHQNDIKNNEQASGGWKISSRTSPHSQSNINIRAAFIHVLGDLVQSFGVVAAALIIKFTGFHLADPICTFVFSALVMATTYSVMRDTIMVLMEAAPKHINTEQLYSDLIAIEGVRDVHSLRVWCLTLGRVAISVHLDTDKGCDSNHVVHEANEILRLKHEITFITIQVQCVCSRSVLMHSSGSTEVPQLQSC